ncbi:hypothetical protein LTR70_010447 [Exophiala xenobiotica]|uniref:Myb-like domain-containing protein n=1 Tax=Lithohypha guttulata TaxID=1690604 RepID=A0ABR0JTW9_9EURO|nr:hypothetical protein LTR24_010430 [Lithohypha guttulata]KAK5309270.1 hypothetical protein LTR70_010447 [Exophiala xenobiotica]
MTDTDPSSRSYEYNFSAQSNDQISQSPVPDARGYDMFPSSNVGHANKPSRAISGSKQSRKRQHRAQQHLAGRLDTTLELAPLRNARHVTAQVGPLDSYRPSMRTLDSGFTGGYSNGNDNNRKRDAPLSLSGYDVSGQHGIGYGTTFRSTRDTAGQRSQSHNSEQEPCEHVSLMQQAMNDTADHDKENAVLRQQLAEREAQVASLQKELEDAVSHETDLAKNMRWWMERALKHKLDYELDSDVFQKTRVRFSRMCEAVDIARRESSAAQQEVIALSHETGEYYKIIREVLKNPTSIDADSIHDRMEKCFTSTRRAQQKRSEAVKARVREAQKNGDVVLDADTIQKVYLEEEGLREEHMRSKDYKRDADIEASIPTASQVRPLTLIPNVTSTPWQNGGRRFKDLAQPIPIEEAERIMGYGPLHTDFTSKEHDAFTKAWRKHSKTEWGHVSKWGDIVYEVGNGRSASDCIRHYRTTGSTEKWEEKSKMGRQYTKDLKTAYASGEDDNIWHRDEFDRD